MHILIVACYYLLWSNTSMIFHNTELNPWTFFDRRLNELTNNHGLNWFEGKNYVDNSDIWIIIQGRRCGHRHADICDIFCWWHDIAFIKQEINISLSNLYLSISYISLINIASRVAKEAKASICSCLCSGSGLEHSVGGAEWHSFTAFYNHSVPTPLQDFHFLILFWANDTNCAVSLPSDFVLNSSIHGTLLCISDSRNLL